MKSNKKKAKTLSGNRCGHSPLKPRFCDLAKRGKGGHPPVIGLICSKLQTAYDQKHILSTWQNLNESGRRRRSEIREAMVSLGQYMFAQWFQLETRRCAVPGGYFLQVPDANHLAIRIGKSDDWQGAPISKGRIDTVFSEWQRAGYITSHQKREKKASGEWKSSPAIRTFTKKFFIELGGKDLWNRVKKAGAKKLKKIQAIIDQVDLTLKEYLNPGAPTPPKIVRIYRKNSSKPQEQKERRRTPDEIRQSDEYKKLYVDKVCELFSQHPPDDPRKLRWAPEEISDNAKRIVDKHFGI